MADNPTQTGRSADGGLDQTVEQSVSDVGAAASTVGNSDESSEASSDHQQDGEDQFDEPLPLDLRYELLKNRRRRRILEYLEAETASTTLGTLAEQLAAEENDKSVSALTSSERKRVYISLYQCHLPKLDDADVIAFDSDRGTVERTERAAELSSYLGERPSADDTDFPPDQDRSRGYLGITGLGVGGVVLQGLLLPGVVSPNVVVALMTVSLLALAVADATA